MPSAKCDATLLATSIDSRVLPRPPRPTSVTCVPGAEQLAHAGNIVEAADEAGDRCRQVVDDRAALDRGVVGQPITNELNELLAVVERTQHVLADRDDRVAVGELTSQEICAATGDEDLSATSHRLNTGRPIDRSEVPHAPIAFLMGNMYGVGVSRSGQVLDAVGEPNRRLLLELLHERTESTVSELVDASGLRQPQVSKHLKVLAGASLVTVRSDGRHRRYRLDSRGLQAAHDWFASFEDVWQARFDALDELVSTNPNTRPSEEKSP